MFQMEGTAGLCMQSLEALKSKRLMHLCRPVPPGRTKASSLQCSPLG